MVILNQDSYASTNNVNPDQTVSAIFSVKVTSAKKEIKSAVGQWTDINTGKDESQKWVQKDLKPEFYSKFIARPSGQGFDSSSFTILRFSDIDHGTYSIVIFSPYC